MMINKLIILSISLFYGTVGLQDNSTANVIIFRKGSFGTPNFNLLLNEKQIETEFKKNTCLELKVKSGSLIIETKGQRFLMGKNQYLIDIKENETYFFEAYIDYDFSIVNLKIKVSNSKEYKKVAHKLNKIVFDEPIQSKQ